MTQQVDSWVYNWGEVEGGYGENTDSKRHMYPSVHCSTIYSRQDMEAS